MPHLPVLLKEIVQCLDPQPNENFIDCTFGQGGHTLAILEKNGPKGKVLGIEADPKILTNTKYKIQDTKYKNRLVLVNDNFANLEKIVTKEKFINISGVLMDLGISSWHLEESKRGFSFMKDEPLLMRLDAKTQETAKEIVNYWPEQLLVKMLQDYGQERFARRIAKAICLSRKAKPIESTFQMVKIIKSAVPKNYERGRLHPATRTFLALRLTVNKELENLEKILPQALKVLERNGKLAVISFNSLEDRLVKTFFKEEARQGNIKVISKKPITPGWPEITANPRARSAKLRVAVKN
jgi:16S rRNA (cytosine1402-N4)-methyltransferase